MKKETLNPEAKKLLEREKRLYKTYGLTYSEWEELVKNGCWVCKRKDVRLNVDHRHIKGYKKLTPEEKRKEVRGCLCFVHNTMLHGVEKFKDSRKQLERMIAYFQVFKMKGDE